MANSGRPVDLGIGSIARRVLVIFVLIEAALFGLDYLIAHKELIDNSDLQNLVDITREDTIGTWVSTTQYLLLAGVAWLIHLRTRDDAGATMRAAGWGLIAGFFTYLSFDDGSRFHERMGSLFGDYAPDVSTPFIATAARELLDFFPSYNWQVAFFPLFGAMALFLLVFLRRELKENSLYAMVLAGLSCWIFAVLLDFLEGASEGMALMTSMFDAGYRTVEHMMRSVEECIELFGATLMLSAFLAHFTRIADGWSIRFVARVERPAECAVVAPEPVQQHLVADL